MFLQVGRTLLAGLEDCELTKQLREVLGAKPEGMRGAGDVDGEQDAAPPAPRSRGLPHPSPSSSPCQSLLGPQGAEKTLRNKFTYQEIPHELSPGAMRREVLAATHAEHRAGGSHAAPWQGERGKRGWERDEHQPQPRCFCPKFCAGSFSTPCPRQPQGHGNYEAGLTAVNPSGKKTKQKQNTFFHHLSGELRAPPCPGMLKNPKPRGSSGHGNTGQLQK